MPRNLSKKEAKIWMEVFFLELRCLYIEAIHFAVPEG